MTANSRSSLDRGNRGNPTGGGGVDDCISWVAAAFKSAVMVRESTHASALGNVRIMNRDRRSQQCFWPASRFGTLALGSPCGCGRHGAQGALPIEPRTTGPASISAAHTGYSRGSSNAVLTDPAIAATSNVFSGVIGGVQAGYNARLSSGLLLGVEADITFPNYLNSNSVVSSIASARSDVAQQWDYVGTARGRIGYASGQLARSTPPAGSPWPASASSTRPLSATRKSTSICGSAGPPAPASNTPSRRTGAHGSNISTASSSAPTSASRPARNTVRPSTSSRSASASTARSTGRDRTTWTPKTALTDPESDRWEIHGQTTYLPQGYPAFRAPYTGTNSLTPAPQAQATWSNSLYLNARLWEGGEVYYNPELLQGFGLNDTVGRRRISQRRGAEVQLPLPALQHLAAVRAPDLRLRRRAGRARQRPSQLAGKVDVSRLTLQAGKFAVIDMFDGNAYAKDTRKDFMNWSMWAPGAFDYSADKVGLTYGATAEFNQKQWALRGGYFLMDAVSNSNNFDTRSSSAASMCVELETRYSLFSQPGKLRTIGWLNSAYSGSYRETLNNPALNLDIAQTRTGRIKYGYVFNLEQAVTDDIGLFGRWSWNDGKTEIMAFTDIDAIALAAAPRSRAPNGAGPTT